MADGPPSWRAFKPTLTHHPARHPWRIADWVLGKIAYWCEQRQFFRLLNVLQGAGILFAVVLFTWEWQKRDDDRVIRLATLINTSWQQVRAAKGARGNQGQIQALEELARRGISLAGVRLMDTFLATVRLPSANLKGARFERADLSFSDLSRTNLGNASLSGTKLVAANLRGADLTGADLSRANLMQADLSGADLNDANLSEADLSGTDLRRASLLKARGLSQDELSKTCMNEETMLRVSVTRPAPCAEGIDGRLIRDADGKPLRK